MRIFNSSAGDPMLFATANGLLALHRSLEAFLNSASLESAFPALTTGNPAPYAEFLLGLKVRKGNRSMLSLLPNGWLELAGSPHDINSFGSKLLTCKNGSHTHWYSTPVSLVIEEGNFEAVASES